MPKRLEARDAAEPRSRPESSPTANRPKRVNDCRHPIAQQALLLLRSKHTSPHVFRAASAQLLVLLLIEATRAFPTKEESVASSASLSAQTLDRPIVFLTIARAGLGLGQRVSDLFPQMVVGSIGFDHKSAGNDQPPQARLNLMNAPALSDSHVVLFDPMIVTGTSASRAMHLLRRSGAKEVSLLSFVASSSGLEMLQTQFSDVTVWSGSIESKISHPDEFAPGAGDFASRYYR